VNAARSATAERASSAVMAGASTLVGSNTPMLALRSSQNGTFERDIMQTLCAASGASGMKGAPTGSALGAPGVDSSGHCTETSTGH
jgi:hypothetical protein